MRDTPPGLTDQIDEVVLLRVLDQVRDGDFTARLPLEWTGAAGKVADRLNEIIASNQALEAELVKLSRVVGTEGSLSHRLALPGTGRAWSSSVESVNDLIGDLGRPTSEMRRVMTALNLALQVSEARERAVLEHVADGVVTAGEGGGIESLNVAAQRLLGYTEEEILGRPLRVLFASDPLEPSADLGDVWGCRKNGSSFPIELELTEIQVGGRTLTVGSMRDLSDARDRAEEEGRRRQALRREAQRDRAAFEDAPLGSVITDPVGRVERVNQAFCAMIGHTAEELIGTSLKDHLVLPDGDEGTELGTALVSEAPTLRLERTLQLRSGRVLDVRVAVTAIRDDRLQVAQYFAQIEDVTDVNRTNRELEAAQYEMLSRLAAAAEFRDDETGQHTRRVGEISVAIAEALGRPAAEVELLRTAAPLHDLGKIAIPDAVLRKPGSLTTAEFDQMKTHTTVGARMLSGGRFALLDVAEQIALTHHERWDGTGYPAGLAGDEIPMAGRIVAVADVYDALTHERPYKSAWSVEDAIAEISAQAGRQFDPLVVKAFLGLTWDGPQSGPELAITGERS